MVRALRLGLAQGRDPGGTHHVQRGRPAAQAGDVHDQLHGVRDRPRLDGRHPRQGARGGPDPEGRLRHRLRVLDAAPARRVRLGCGRLHLRPAVVHGYLRQDVLHGVLGGRPPRCADGHLRRRPPGRHRLHPRQARERPPAAVQPVAAGHGRVHPGGARRRGLEARLPAVAGRVRPGTARPRGPGPVRLARVAGDGPLCLQRRGTGRLQGLPQPSGAAPVGRHHDVHLRLRRAGLRPDRPRQRDEQQLVVREHPRHQPLRRAAAAPLRFLPAGLGEPDALRAQAVHGRGRVRLGRVPRGGADVHPHARQRGRDQRPAARPPA